MTSSVLEMIAPFVAERVLHSLPQGLLIAALSWAVLRIIPVRNSQTRFAVWFSALLAIAALAIVPAVHSPGTRVAAPEILLPEAWAIAIFSIWTFVAAAAMVRVAVGLWQLRRLRRSCVPVAVSDLDPALQSTILELQANRRVAICSSSAVEVPTAMGFFKPVIVIPAWALRELSLGELKVILLHEFAHLRRWDDWTNLIQKAVRALFFFHPAVWWIEKRLSLEREMACDDTVLAQTQNPRAYAECIVTLAEKSFLRRSLERSLALAQAAISRVGETSQRIARILDHNRSSTTRAWKPALGVVGGLSIVCLVMLSRTPTLVGFTDSTPVRTVQTVAVHAPRLPQAQVIPASIRVETPVAVQASTAVQAHALLANIRKPGHTPDSGSSRSTAPPVLASTRPNQPRTTAVVPAAAKSKFNSTPRNSASHMLVVMQTTQYDARGSAVWTLCVWRVTLVSPQSNTTQPSAPAKSI